MNAIIPVILFVTLVPISNSQTGWVQQNSGTSASLQSVFFVSETTGYACGGNVILKTTDGASSWQSQILPGSALHSLYFQNADSGYCATSGTYIYRTTNGGQNWTQVNFGTSHFCYSAFFLNFSTGFVGTWAKSGSTQRTTNGGNNWTYSLLSGSYPRDIFFTNQNTGFVTDGYLYKTTNSGANWSPAGFIGLTNLFFVNDTIGYAANGAGAYYSTIKKTTNFGSNWITLDSGGQYPRYSSLFFTNRNTGYVVGQKQQGPSTNIIKKTSNGGLNWIEQHSSLNILNDVFFVSSSVGYAVGNTGLILKTTNGGVTAITPISNEIPREVGLYQNYPNPFNPSTKIKFSIPAGTRRGVFLRVYDAIGREVSTLVNEQLVPGIYEVQWDASNYPSGVYYYKLVSGSYNETKKMLMIK